MQSAINAALPCSGTEQDLPSGLGTDPNESWTLFLADMAPSGELELQS